MEEKQSIMRVRTANIMQYEEFLSEEKIKIVLSCYKQIEKWAYVRHDKDVADEPEKLELKKPHFHIVLKL
mgnify:CR=1 FL=1